MQVETYSDKSLNETEYLLGNPYNKKKILEALNEDDKDNVKFDSVEEFRKKFGIKKDEK